MLLPQPSNNSFSEHIPVVKWCMTIFKIKNSGVPGSAVISAGEPTICTFPKFTFNNGAFVA